MQINRLNKSVEEVKSKVLRQSANENEIKLITRFRNSLSKNKMMLITENHGAGSRINMRKKTISNMADQMSVGRKTGNLLYNIAKFQMPDVIIELGTAFGISTLYMHYGWPSAEIITIEGNSQLGMLAEKNFTEMGIKNISVLKNSFEDILPKLKISSDKKYMIFIDGNHTYEATLRYYRKFVNESVVIVFDDILWSSGMIDAWNLIKKSPDSGLTIDLFNTGIIFPAFKKSNYIFWY